MNGCMNGLNGWMDEWMNEWMEVATCVSVVASFDARLCVCMHVYIYVCMYVYCVLCIVLCIRCTLISIVQLCFCSASTLMAHCRETPSLMAKDLTKDGWKRYVQFLSHKPKYNHTYRSTCTHSFPSRWSVSNIAFLHFMVPAILTPGTNVIIMYYAMHTHVITHHHTSSHIIKHYHTSSHVIISESFNKLIFVPRFSEKIDPSFAKRTPPQSTLVLVMKILQKVCCQCSRQWNTYLYAFVFFTI